MRLLIHELPFATSRARCRAGSSIAARIAIMAITTRSSINVNFRRRIFSSLAVLLFDKFYQNDSGIPFVVDVDTSFALFKIDLLKFIVFIQQFHLSHPDGRIKGDMLNFGYDLSRNVRHILSLRLYLDDATQRTRLYDVTEQVRMTTTPRRVHIVQDYKETMPISQSD